MSKEKFSITLTGNIFEYRTLKQLQKEALKYNIFIGDNVSIGCHVSIGYNVSILVDSYIGDHASVGNNISIGSGSSIGDDVSVGDYVSIGGLSSVGNDVFIGDDASIGCDVSIEKYVSIGEDVSILTRAKIQKGWKIDKITHLMNEYKYHISGYISNDEIIIQMGCFTRTLSEWEDNFWNNNDEFPENSPQGKKRLTAFNKMKDIMKIIQRT